MPDVIIATNKAVFLDIENLLIPDSHSGLTAIPILLTAQMVLGLKRLMVAGYQLIAVAGRLHDDTVVTDEALIRKEQLTDEVLVKNGIELSGYYYYAEGKNGSQHELLKARKYLFLEAAKAHRFDLSASWVVSTVLKVLKAGKLVGCKTLLLETTDKTVQHQRNRFVPDFSAYAMDDAADYILD